MKTEINLSQLILSVVVGFVHVLLPYMKCYPFTLLHDFVHDFMRKFMPCFSDLVSKTAFVFVFLEEDKNCSLANFVLFTSQSGEWK